jgi:hypothetical protein
MDSTRNPFVEMSPLLEQMRESLVAQLNEAEGEEAWGPDSKSQSSKAPGKAGTSGAENESDDIWNAFDLYVNDLIDDLLELYEISEDEAIDFIFEVADDLAAEGKMPEIPTEEGDAKAVAAWVGAAGTIGFERMVLDAAEEAASEE